MKKIIALLMSCVMLFSVCAFAETAYSYDTTVTLNGEELRAVITSMGSEIPEEAEPILTLAEKVINKLNMHGVLTQTGTVSQINLGNSELAAFYLNWELNGEDGITATTDLLPSYAFRVSAEEIQQVLAFVQQIMSLDYEAYLQPVYQLIANFKATCVEEAVTFEYNGVTYTTKETYTLTAQMLADAANDIVKLLKADLDKLGLGNVSNISTIDENVEGQLDVEIYANENAQSLLLVKNGEQTGMAVTFSVLENIITGEFAIDMGNDAPATGAFTIVADGAGANINVSMDTVDSYSETHFTLAISATMSPVPTFTYAARTEMVEPSYDVKSVTDANWSLAVTGENTLACVYEYIYDYTYGSYHSSVAMKETADLTVVEDGINSVSCLYLNGSETPLFTTTASLRVTDETIAFPEVNPENMTVLTIADLSNLDMEALEAGAQSDLIGYALPRAMMALQTEMPEEYSQILSLVFTYLQ